MQPGDRVRAGEPLQDGPANPHDILRVKGEKELAAWLVNEIQQVYRLQGVGINDKHIEVIVRQMLRRVRIKEVGDTNFLVDEQVEKHVFERENERVIERGGQPGGRRAAACSASPRRRSRPSRSSARRRSRRPPRCSPRRRSAARRTISAASRRTSSWVASSRPARACAAYKRLDLVVEDALVGCGVGRRRADGGRSQRRGVSSGRETRLPMQRRRRLRAPLAFKAPRVARRPKKSACDARKSRARLLHEDSSSTRTFVAQEALMHRRNLSLARLAILTCLGVFALDISSAHAALWVCHRVNSNSPINFDFMNQTPTRCSSGWYERGWFTVNPGKCIKVWTGDVPYLGFLVGGVPAKRAGLLGNDTFKADIPLGDHRSGMCREDAAAACTAPEAFCRWSSLM